MQMPYFEQLERVRKAAWRAGEALEAINGRLLERLVEEQLAVIDSCLKTGVKQLSAVTSSRDLSELLGTELTLAMQCNEKLLGSARKTADLLTGACRDWAAWVERGLEELRENSFAPRSATAG